MNFNMVSKVAALSSYRSMISAFASLNYPPRAFSKNFDRTASRMRCAGKSLNLEGFLEPPMECSSAMEEIFRRRMMSDHFGSAKKLGNASITGNCPFEELKLLILETLVKRRGVSLMCSCNID